MTVGPTPDAAARTLRTVLQQALSCVTHDVLTSQTYTAERELMIVSRLVPRSGEPLTLALRHIYTVLSDASRPRSGHWQARTTTYYYKLDDADGREILAYHRHPTGRSSVTRPHLLLGAAAGALRSELQKAHLGTGFVTPVTLLALLIESFAVRPRRADWATVLEAADDALALPWRSDTVQQPPPR